MIVHEMMEKRKRINTTNLATGPADERSPSIPPVYKSTLDMIYL
jgi:hypothetical protein